MDLGLYTTLSLRDQAISSAGARFLSYCPARPIDVIRFGVITSTAPSAAGVSELRYRTLIASAGSEVTVSSFTLTSASFFGGRLCFKEIRPFRIYPGQMVLLYQQVGAGAGSTGEVFIDYQVRPFHKRDTSTPYFKSLRDQNPGVG
jgi:hypothetical protein